MNLRAGLAGPGQPGPLHPQHDAHPLGRGGRGLFPRRGLPAHAAGHRAAQAPRRVLWADLRAGGLRAQRVPGRRL